MSSELQKNFLHLRRLQIPTSLRKKMDETQARSEKEELLDVVDSVSLLQSFDAECSMIEFLRSDAYVAGAAIATFACALFAIESFISARW